MKSRRIVYILIGVYILGLTGCAPASEASLPIPGESLQGTAAQTFQAPSLGTAEPNLSAPLHELTTTPETRPGGQPAPLPTLDERTFVVGMAENGKTLTFAAGQRFILVLDQGYVWQIMNTDPTIVAPLDEPAPQTDALGYYEALQPGQTKLSASGDPLCRAAKPPCMMPSILFEITIIVD